MTDRQQASQERMLQIARRKQKEALREAMNDPESRAAIVNDPRIRDLVRAEVAAERARQEYDERLAREEEARRRAEEFAPRQNSTKANPYAGDPTHDPRVTEAMARGASMAEVQRLVRVVQAEQARAREQRTERDGVMWETRNGTLLADSAKAFPGVGPGLPPNRGQVSRPVPGSSQFPDRQPDPAPVPGSRPASVWSEPDSQSTDHGGAQ